MNPRFFIETAEGRTYQGWRGVCTGAARPSSINKMRTEKVKIFWLWEWTLSAQEVRHRK